MRGFERSSTLSCAAGVVSLLLLNFSQLADAQDTAVSTQQGSPQAIAAINQPPLPTNSPLIDSTYTLGPGDDVTVTFFNVPEYSGEQTVVVDGTLNFPMLGRISVTGMTLAEAEVAIAEQFRSELRYPSVSIALVRPRPLQVGIVGEVSRPGLYTINSTQSQQIQIPSLAQIIQVAGGTTQAANLRQVEIRRLRRVGAPQVFAVNLWEFLRNGDISQNVTLRDGDTVVIPATADVNVAETVQLAASNLAAADDQVLDVALVGEVRRPGAYKLGPDGQSIGHPTLTRALQLAGGITPAADLQHIEIRRPTRSGQEQVIPINLWDVVRSGDLSQDLVLQQGDRVIVPTATALTPEETVQLAAANVSPDKIRVSVAGEVISPGALQLSPDTTLNQAILSAGGFNPRANRSVDLVRLNPDGTVTRTAIVVDLSQNVNADDNPILRDGDVILARRSGLASVTDSLGQVGDFLSPLTNILRIFF